MASCGTRAGYVAHRRAGENACDSCAEAERTYQRERYRRNHPPSVRVAVKPRTCEIAGCDRPHAARGLCSSHYGTWHRLEFGRKDLTYTHVCEICGNGWTSRSRNARFCSDQCKGQNYSSTMRRSSALPDDHPVMLLVAQAKEAERQARRKAMRPKRSAFEWRTARECPGCACWFTPLFTPNAITCSTRCSRRVQRWRRKAAERKATGTFTWSEFMHVARRFNYCCAYCGQKPDGQLDPDHVVPLSRGGINSTTNLLPACRSCNADKRDLLLHEWSEDRAKRGLAPRLTTWGAEDRRFAHLTQAMLIAA